MLGAVYQTSLKDSFYASSICNSGAHFVSIILFSSFCCLTIFCSILKVSLTFLKAPSRQRLLPMHLTTYIYHLIILIRWFTSISFDITSHRIELTCSLIFHPNLHMAPKSQPFFSQNWVIFGHSQKRCSNVSVMVP